MRMQGAGQINLCLPSSSQACMVPTSTPPPWWLAHLIIMILQTGNQLSLLATDFEPAFLQLFLQVRDL